MPIEFTGDNIQGIKINQLGSYHKPTQTKPKKIMKNKGVSFNLADPHQKELHMWASRLTNFSDTVKRLLENEMEKQKKTPLNE